MFRVGAPPGARLSFAGDDCRTARVVKRRNKRLQLSCSPIRTLARSS